MATPANAVTPLYTAPPGPVGPTISNAPPPAPMPGQVLTPDQVTAAQQGFQSANQTYQTLNTPDQRQQALDNTSIAPMQANYMDLAKKLAAFDTGVLQPQFAGSNPGQPAGLPTGGDVMWNPNISTAGTTALPSNQGIYNSNPFYGLQAQGMQGDSILSLLTTLNDAIGKETQRGQDIYGGKLRSAASALSGFKDILGMNADLTAKNAEIGLGYARLNQDKTLKLMELGYLDPTGSPIVNGISDNSPLGSSLDTLDPERKRLQQQYMKYPAQSPIAQQIATNWKASHGTDLFPDPRLLNVVNDLGTVDQTTQNQTGSGTAAKTLVKLNGNILGIPGTMLISGKDEQNLADLESKYFALVQTVLTSIQGTRPSDFDVKSYQQKLGPSIANPPSVNADRIKNLMNLVGVSVKSGVSDGSSGTTVMSGPGGTFSVPNDKVERFKQNGYK